MQIERTNDLPILKLSQVLAGADDLAAVEGEAFVEGFSHILENIPETESALSGFESVATVLEAEPDSSAELHGLRVSNELPNLPQMVEMSETSVSAPEPDPSPIAAEGDQGSAPIPVEFPVSDELVQTTAVDEVMLDDVPPDQIARDDNPGHEISVHAFDFADTKIGELDSSGIRHDVVNLERAYTYMDHVQKVPEVEKDRVSISALSELSDTPFLGGIQVLGEELLATYQEDKGGNLLNGVHFESSHNDSEDVDIPSRELLSVNTRNGPILHADEIEHVPSRILPGSLMGSQQNLFELPQQDVPIEDPTLTKHQAGEIENPITAGTRGVGVFEKLNNQPILGAEIQATIPEPSSTHAVPHSKFGLETEMLKPASFASSQVAEGPKLYLAGNQAAIRLSVEQIEVSASKPEREPRIDFRAKAVPESQVSIEPNKQIFNVAQQTSSLTMFDGMSKLHGQREIHNYRPEIIQSHATVPSRVGYAPSQTPSPVTVTSQIVQAMNGSTERTLEVRLTPEELGTVRIVIANSEAGTHIGVFAERAETLDLLKRDSGSFDAELVDLGFERAEFSFQRDGETSEDEQTPQRGNSELGVLEQGEATNMVSRQTTRLSDRLLDIRL